MAYVQALVDCMVTFYREKVERLENLLEVIQANYRSLREDYIHLKANYERLEDWAHEQEQRADALHDVIDSFINRSGTTVRRDLLDSFNEVANDLDVDLDLSGIESDFSLELIEDSD